MIFESIIGNEKVIDLSSFAKGIYLVRVGGNDTSFVTRIVLN
ncbi:MAG: T9SS type A sorting domain-containing protein [Cyclobacteriaceae bacterium]|nr:T9SS type A sorting domain-containing protein [Cyclobacteriaceae bacterium]